MAEHEDADYQSADAGASKTYPAQCSSLRKGGHVLLKGRPCKIVEMSTSKTGKHGHAKVHLIGIDIFTGKKHEDVCPSTHNMDVPHVTRRDLQLLNIEGGFLSLMNDAGDQRDDIRLPEGDIGTEIQAKFDADEQFLVTVLAAMGEETAIATKNMTK